MSVQKIESKAQFDSLLGSDKLFFVDFYADWCGPCKQISPIFESLAQENTKEGVVEFYKVDIDEIPEIAEELSIRSIPLFHAYKGKERVDKVVGANRAALTGLLQTSLSKFGLSE